MYWRTAVFVSETCGMTSHTLQVTLQVTPQVAALLDIMDGEMDRGALQAGLGVKDRIYFRKAYLIPAMESGLIEMTIPDKPRSSKQKYRLTYKAQHLLAEKTSETTRNQHEE